MKINLVSLTMFAGGTLLVYSGVKGFDPRDVIRWALGGKKPTKMGSDGNVKPKVPEGEYPGDLGLPKNPDDTDVIST